MSELDYSAFLETKRERVNPVGFEVQPEEINGRLFRWQSDIVRWALQRGRAALFEDCGLGKTAQQLEWARHVVRHTGRAVLIVAPLAVSDQTVREGAKFGIEVVKCREAFDFRPAAVNVTNYERLGKFHPADFAGIVLDESSILKAYDGKMRRDITDFARKIEYRLCCTATPAPNDTIELCNHAEFLDIMSGKEMLALFFRQDGNTTHKWRLKAHARRSFWQWMAEWSIAVRKPSDIGYSDDGYILPDLVMFDDVVTNTVHEGFLFAMESSTLAERRASRRDTIGDRVALAARLCNESTEQWLVWCDFNAEGDALAAAIPDSVQVKGSDSNEHKEKALNDFATGKLRVLVSKPSIAGFGMNFQICHNVIFVGLSDSYESFYQAIRRCWRFGQNHSVMCHVIRSDSDGSVVENIKRKERQAGELFDEIVKNYSPRTVIGKSRRDELDYAPTVPMEFPCWLRTVA